MRIESFRSQFHVPDGWPLPDEIIWYDCLECGMIFGDGDFDQEMLDRYYRQYYGYGINGPDNIERLKRDAARIEGWVSSKQARILDFGGAGDDGRSLIVDHFQRVGYTDAHCTGPNEPLPQDCDLIYASHVLEHIYDLPHVMTRLGQALKPEGVLVVDIPEAAGILLHWQKAILDYNTKHINHFTIRTMLDLLHRYGFELVDHRDYTLEGAPCVQFVCKRLDIAEEARRHIEARADETLAKLAPYSGPVNLWGLNDRVWSIIDRTRLDVLNYIDNDPAYRGQTYRGKPVLERPDNDAPILIICQGQGGRLVANIKKWGIQNKVVEI
jgi:predicted SAM-dependent methyltransferase